ncbi:MAG: cytochrome c1, partial [Rhodobacteraceae bacterium]|nr:cytochrome c1 [Paracoccaceae bacterium]
MLKSIALAASVLIVLGTAAMAAGKKGHVDDYAFPHEGPFGTYDAGQLQRGLQVYQEACAACHGLKYVPLRTLGDEAGPGLSPETVRAFASTIEIYDPVIDDFRPALPTDHFPANTSVGAPDLSLMTKARSGFSGPVGTGLNQLFRGIGGPEYLVSLLMGYTGEEKQEAGVTLYENTAFPGGWISMAPPLSDGLIEYADGSANNAEALALDLAAFLTWTAEPKKVVRRHAGFMAVALLTLLAVLLYLTNKRLWMP